MKTDLAPDYMTARQVAEELGDLDTRIVNRWCREGKFMEAVRLPGRVGWRIPRESFEIFIHQLSRPAIRSGETNR